MAKNRNTVLVVEDDKNLSKMLDFLFVAKGLATVSAGDGAEALRLMERTKPQAVILDLMMPVMDGYEFLRRMKADDKWRDLPVVVLSALPSEQKKDEVMNLGAADYFEKPFKSTELVSAVVNLIEKSEKSPG